MSTKTKKSDDGVAFEAAISAIEKKFGKGSLMRLGSAGPSQKIDAISTGSLALDMALGIDGVPRGRIVEIYGSESAGKSTLALSVVAQAQKSGGRAAYIDAEHALDPGYAQKIGVDTGELLLAQPDSAEQALQITEELVSSGALDVVVVDSVAALVPLAELEGEMGDMQVGAQARLMSKAMRKMTGIISKTGTTAIFINQLRQKVGVVFGNPEVTAGGQALKFYASVRIDLRRKEQLKTGNDPVGIKVRARIVKNKMAPPFRVAEFDVMFAEGISREGELVDLGMVHGVLKRAGASYSFGDEKLGQGKEAVSALLKQKPALYDKIKKAVVDASKSAPQASN